MTKFANKPSNSSAASHKNELTGINFETFAKAHQEMIGASTDAYNEKDGYSFSRYFLSNKDYTPEELIEIINHGSVEQ